eukprot:g5449.t1
MLASETIDERDIGFTIHAMEDFSSHPPPSGTKEGLDSNAGRGLGEKEANGPPVPFPNVHFETYEAGAVSSCGWYYSCLENETCHVIGKKFDCNAQRLMTLNRDHYPGLNLKAKLYELTVLRLPKQITMFMKSTTKKKFPEPSPSVAKKRKSRPTATAGKPPVKILPRAGNGNGAQTARKRSKRAKGGEAKNPNRSGKPMSPYITFGYRLRQQLPNQKLSPTEVGQAWKSKEYEHIRKSVEADYLKLLDVYKEKQKKAAEFYKLHPELDPKRLRKKENAAKRAAAKMESARLEAQKNDRPTPASKSRPTAVLPAFHQYQNGQSTLANATISKTLLAQEDWLEVTSTDDLAVCRGRCRLNPGESDVCLVLPDKFVELSGGNFVHMSIQVTPMYDFSLLRYRNTMPWPSLAAGINVVNNKPVIIVAAFPRGAINENLPFFLHITTPKRAPAAMANHQYQEPLEQQQPPQPPSSQQQQFHHLDQYTHAAEPQGQYHQQMMGFFQQQQQNGGGTMM